MSRALACLLAFEFNEETGRSRASIAQFAGARHQNKAEKPECPKKTENDRREPQCHTATNTRPYMVQAVAP